MKFQTFTSLLCALVLTPAVCAVAAEPTVDSILSKYVEALGGKATLEKVQSRVVKVKVESESFGTSEGTFYAKPPNKQRSEIEISGQGTLSEGFDGTTAWAKTPWQDLREKTGDELAKVKRDAEFHRELKLKSLYPGLAYKGTEKIGEEEGYVLESKPTSSSKEKFVFSSKSGLLLRQESEYSGQDGNPVIIIVSPLEYKTFEGMKYPARMKMKYSMGGQTFEFTMSFTELKSNVEIDEAKFKKPSA